MAQLSPQQALPEALTLAQLPREILEEVIRQLRSTRNDIIRFGVWNIRNLTDDDFNKTDDRKLLGYFRQDLLETRFLSKGRRIDLIQLWRWFDDLTTGVDPLLVDGEEVFLNVQDKDLEKVRKRIQEIQSFLPTLRGDDLDAFRRVKYKLRRTVMRLTYDLHHLFKRLEKHRKNIFMTSGAPPIERDRIPLEAVADIPEPIAIEESED
ncbi:MAG TPA: hypothetical protein VGQ36_05370 [Thermoanaerobaculia bacterium]|jgi:hypothetical protein|nr:hypothetical protein [Thermoanaerobaculia bacterium]